MLRGIYVPTDFESVNQDPTIPAAEKLRIIAGSPTTAEATNINGKIYEDEFSIYLPFVDGSVFAYGLNSMQDLLFTNHVNVGDAELYGHGIGGRMLRSATRFAVERDARIQRFATGGARVGLINTVVKVFGVIV